MALYVVLAVILVFLTCCLRAGSVPDVYALDSFRPIRPTLPPLPENSPDPIRWLKENLNDKHAISRLPTYGLRGRPRAAIISLVRNSELDGMMQSMRQLEYRWNRKYQVYIFTRLMEGNMADIFTVSLGILQRRTLFRDIQSRNKKLNDCRMPLRSCAKRTLGATSLD